MELRHLRYFVTVVQTHSFTRAAELLGMSQPPLSQQILRLEQEIGTPLLKRLTRSVELTKAGKAFYHDACQIIELTTNSMEKAKSIARGVSGQISLGFTNSIASHSAVFILLHDFKQSYPNISLLLREANMATLIKDLHAGSLDAAFIRLPCEDSKAFNLNIFASENMRAALPPGHALSKQPHLSLSQLADDPLIIFPREMSPCLYEMVLSACLRAGFQPHIGQQSPQIISSLGLVAAGFGFTIVPDSLCCIRYPGVTFHTIEDAALHTDIALAWRRLEHSPAVIHLATMISAL